MGKNLNEQLLGKWNYPYMGFNFTYILHANGTYETDMESGLDWYRGRYELIESTLFLHIDERGEMKVFQITDASETFIEFVDLSGKKWRWEK